MTPTMTNSRSLPENSIQAHAWAIMQLADACQPPPWRASPSLDPRYPLQGSSAAAKANRKAARSRLLKRDGPNCCHCGAEMLFPSTETGDSRSHPHFASIEHMVETRNGGTDDDDNLKLACLPCNQQRDIMARQDEEENARHSAMHRLLRGYRRGNAVKLTIEQVVAICEEVFELPKEIKDGE